MKKCNKCGLIKINTDFHKKASSKDGLFNWCKNCSNEQRKTRPQTMHLVRTKAVENLGSKCIGCGFSDSRALQIDHVNGGGTQERKTVGYYQILKKVSLGLTDGYQLLCANCNCIKRIEEDEHRPAAIIPESPSGTDRRRTIAHGGF